MADPGVPVGRSDRSLRDELRELLRMMRASGAAAYLHQGPLCDCEWGSRGERTGGRRCQVEGVLKRLDAAVDPPSALPTAPKAPEEASERSSEALDERQEPMTAARRMELAAVIEGGAEPVRVDNVVLMTGDAGRVLRWWKLAAVDSFAEARRLRAALVEALNERDRLWRDTPEFRALLGSTSAASSPTDTKDVPGAVVGAAEAMPCPGCPECAGKEHHWVVDCDENERTLLTCLHCAMSTR